MNATDEATGLTGYAGRVGQLIESGVIGPAGSEDALLVLLAGCRTRAAADAVWRTARRWEYATDALPPWVDWRQEIEATRN